MNKATLSLTAQCAEVVQWATMSNSPKTLRSPQHDQGGPLAELTGHPADPATALRVGA